MLSTYGAFSKCWLLIMVVTDFPRYRGEAQKRGRRWQGFPFTIAEAGVGVVGWMARLPTSFPEPTVWTSGGGVSSADVAGAVCKVRAASRGVKGFQ